MQLKTDSNKESYSCEANPSLPRVNSTLRFLLQAVSPTAVAFPFAFAAALPPTPRHRTATAALPPTPGPSAGGSDPAAISHTAVQFHRRSSSAGEEEDPASPLAVARRGRPNPVSAPLLHPPHPRLPVRRHPVELAGPPPPLELAGL